MRHVALISLLASACMGRPSTVARVVAPADASQAPADAGKSDPPADLAMLPDASESLDAAQAPDLAPPPDMTTYTLPLDAPCTADQQCAPYKDSRTSCYDQVCTLIYNVQCSTGSTATCRCNTPATCDTCNPC